jgi:RNA polymerase sigma-70 factor (ECF subfamily)
MRIFSRARTTIPAAPRDTGIGDHDVDVSDVRAVYRAHGRFVWVSLQRMGVRTPDLEDVAHDVFLIVHRRLHLFDSRSKITSWLFGICLRVAANYRRQRRWTTEVLSGSSHEERPALQVVAADDILVRREEREIAERALSRLNVELRATFVMFEIESLTGQEIADMTGVPIGTVYSRLHSARRQLDKTIARELKRRGIE